MTQNKNKKMSPGTKISKVNGGSSYPNQGDRDRDDVPSNGANIPVGAYSPPPKRDAKQWKLPPKTNPTVPDYLA